MNPVTFFLGEKVKLSFFTSLSADECVHRLRKGVAKKRSNKWWDYTSGVAGDIDDHKFVLWKITLPIYRNSWNPLYYGEIHTNHGASIITGSFDIEWWVKGFTILMIAFELGIGIMVFVLGSNENHLHEITLLSLVFGLVLIAGFVRTLMRVGQREYYKIIEFIETKLDATPNPIDMKRIDLLNIPHP